MLRKNNNLADAKRWRGALWLALFSIGWFQLSAAAHQFDHVGQQIDESCEVCVQLDRADDAAANTSTATATVAAGDTLARQVPESVADRIFLLGFDSRAPPRI